MSCHRLLQRGFARLYGYNLSATDKPVASDGVPADSTCLTEFSESAMMAENMKDLHYKMKGARYLIICLATLCHIAGVAIAVISPRPVGLGLDLDLESYLRTE